MGSRGKGEMGARRGQGEGRDGGGERWGGGRGEKRARGGERWGEGKRNSDRGEEKMRGARGVGLWGAVPQLSLFQASSLTWLGLSFPVSERLSPPAPPGSQSHKARATREVWLSLWPCRTGLGRGEREVAPTWWPRPRWGW